MMKIMGVSLFALGLVVPGLTQVTGSYSSGSEEEKAGGPNKERRFTVDVAMDGRTVRFNRGITYQEAGRGDTFVIFGPIYPAGTLPTGAASNSPDDPGSIGAWTFRATLTYDGGVSRGSGLEACCGLPVVDTPPLWIQARRGRLGVVDLFNQLGMGTAHYQFDNGGTLVVDGPVSRPTGAVAVVGGMGAFSGAAGELTGVAIGTNSTGYPNLRITFTLMSPRK
ncbi:MAG: hypothetical protein ACRD7E_15185 [Bryobacteraceae bacterium]